MKVSLGKTRAILFSFHVDALLRRSPLNTLSRNQQMLLQKWGYPNYKRQARLLNEMVKGDIGELTHKPMLQKKNKGEGNWGSSERREPNPPMFIECCTYEFTVWDDAEGQRLWEERCKIKWCNILLQSLTTIAIPIMLWILASVRTTYLN